MVRFLRLRRLRAVFRGLVLPGQRPRRAAAQRRCPVRHRLHRPPHRRLAVRPPRGFLRPSQRPDAVRDADVLRLADDRGAPHLSDHRHRRADPAGPRPHHPGPQPGRGIRHERHLSHRGGGREAPGLLFQLPVRHADRRAAVCHSRAAPVAAGVPDGRRTEGLGLAHSLRHRRAPRHRRPAHAPQSARDGRIRRRQGRGQTGKFHQGTAQIPARGAAGRRPHHGRHHGLLHLHHVHAEVPETIGGPQRPADHARDGLFARLRTVPAADLRRRLGPHRAQDPAHRLRRGRHALHHPAARRLAGDQQRLHGVPADCRGVADRCGIYLHQCSREGGAVPDQGARHRRRPALCPHRLHLRRHGGIDRPLVQDHRPRALVLLLSDGCDRRVPAGLSPHARYQAHLGHGSSRVASQRPLATLRDPA